MKEEDLATNEIIRGSQYSVKTLNTLLTKFPEIPKPQKIGAGRGRGVRLVWPKESLEKIRTIKILRQAGLRDNEISAVLKGVENE
jgi:hypothetical protein